MKGGAGHEGTRAQPRPARSLLFSFMNVHMSRSSGLCAKEQFPTYWHLRPFCAWMQSCGGRGEPPGSLWIVAAPAGEHAPPGPHGTPGQGPTAPAPHAGTHVVLLWEVANGWQWPHRHPFPLGLGHHQKDPPLLGPAAGQRRGPVREGSGRASGYVTSTERRPPCLWCLRPPPPPAPAHQCRALALQYLRSLSGSTTCPFLQHWPHTNFICRSKVLGPCAREAPCRRETSEAVSTRAEALGSATQVASGSVRATQLLGMGWSSITYWWEVTPNCTQRLREVTHPPMGKWPEDRDLT